MRSYVVDYASSPHLDNFAHSWRRFLLFLKMLAFWVLMWGLSARGGIIRKTHINELSLELRTLTLNVAFTQSRHVQ